MESGQLRLEQGEYYVDVHIPPGAPLTPESCHASYASAAEFFRNRYGLTKIIFGCHSWLLSPDLEELLPEKSNILAFAHDYTILETTVDPQNRDLAKIFHVPAMPEDIDTLPGDTSLHRAFKEWLKAGKSINNAFGVMLYE